VKAKRYEGTMVYFDFVCPGCKSEGELGIDTTEGYKTFGCPAGCGATFLPYRDRRQRWVLRCVVQPVFEPEANA
jgi:hypothetical protein